MRSVDNLPGKLMVAKAREVMVGYEQHEEVLLLMLVTLYCGTSDIE